MTATAAPESNVAARKSWKRPLVVLAAFALAIALPFALRAAFPQWISLAFSTFVVSWMVAPIVAIWAFHGSLTAIAPRVLPLKWATYVPTLILCAATVWYGWDAGNGMILVFVYLCLFVWVPWSLLVVVQKPTQFIPRVVKLCLWIGAIAIVTSLCTTRRTEAFAMANSYLQVIEQYKRTHGDYPENLQAAGLTDPGHRVLDYHYSRGDDGTPMLMMRDAFNPFDMWFYQFDERKWEFHPD